MISEVPIEKKQREISREIIARAADLERFTKSELIALEKVLHWFDHDESQLEFSFSIVYRNNNESMDITISMEGENFVIEETTYSYDAKFGGHRTCLYEYVLSDLAAEEYGDIYKLKEDAILILNRLENEEEHSKIELSISIEDE
ncbi:hypothetical protein [Winogradskyella algicola]|uniref:hypothetical protein n=1 Tax=Winogradskyella algicola TaxID=2575815 RepID=UPI0011081015|nr:hypothetical protein [Winogradskyella algicola]